VASFAICWLSSCCATIWATVTCDLARLVCSSVHNFCKSALSCGLRLFGGCEVEVPGTGVFGVVDEDVVVLTEVAVDAPEVVAGVIAGVAAVGVGVGVDVVGVVVVAVDVDVVGTDEEVVEDDVVVAGADEFMVCEAHRACRPNPCREPCCAAP